MRTIMPSEINGTVRAPPSKSMMQRAVAASLLAEGESAISAPSFSDDCQAAMRVAEGLGARITRMRNAVIVSGGNTPKSRTLDCGESGLCLRMFSPIAALFDRRFTLTGRGSLLSRPVGMVEEPLLALGASCRTNKGMPPVTVKGPVKGGHIEVDGSISSQFLTGLLMALPLCKDDSAIVVSNLKSKPYVKMTMSLLNIYGVAVSSGDNMERFDIEGNQTYRASSYEVEGDWSGAAFILVAGAIGGKVRVDNLSPASLQADREILNALEAAGAVLRLGDDSVTAEKQELHGFEFDAKECPDLFPPLVALACNCKGKTRILGVERLKYKESSRALALASEFSKSGAKLKIRGDMMEVTGGQLEGGAVDSHNDHRIAMACAVAGINSRKGVSVRNCGCVSKSYPEFFDDLTSLCVGGVDR